MYVAPVGLWAIPLGEISNWSRRTGVDILCPLAVVAVAKARQLEASDYQVRITDRRGRQFTPCESDELLH
jgi:hypothetical protein